MMLSPASYVSHVFPCSFYDLFVVASSINVAHLLVLEPTWGGAMRFLLYFAGTMQHTIAA